MKYTINLLLPKKKGIVDSVMYFAFNYLRYILVFTQLIVIGVFFYRIKVDQDIVELREELTHKYEIFETAQPTVDFFKDISSKTDNINRILSKQETFDSMISYLFDDRFPRAFDIEQMSVESESISFNGTAPALTDIKIFYERMQQEERFKKVSLNNIKRQEGGYSYVFHLEEFVLEDS